MSWLSASLPGESLLAENKKGVEVEDKFLVEGRAFITRKLPVLSIQESK